jgi:hypothetical protein
MADAAKRHEANSTFIKEIRASADATTRNQGASIKALEQQIGQMSKVLQERGYGGLPGSTEKNPRDHVKAIITTEVLPNVPFPGRLLNGDALKPQYFFNSLISVRRFLREKSRIEDEIKAAMKEECSAIDQNALPHKENDPGSFTLPWNISS